MPSLNHHRKPVNPDWGYTATTAEKPLPISGGAEVVVNVQSRDAYDSSLTPDFRIPGMSSEVVYDFNSIQGDQQMSPERKLMLAVLVTAVEAYAYQTVGSLGMKKVAAQEAQEWIASQDDYFLFSFITVCDYLEFNPQKIRSGVFKYAPGEMKMALYGGGGMKSKPAKVLSELATIDREGDKDDM